MTGEPADAMVRPVALITGAASGIGRAAALRFADAGYRVAAADLVAEACEETATLVRARGGEAEAFAVDVAVRADVDAMFDRLAARFGRLDAAINNAGVAPAGEKAAEIPEEDFDRTMAVNVRGVWLCMRREIPMMLANGGGAIVNTSSTTGLTGHARAAEYTASKHAVIGLTKAAALDYAKAGVRINAVCPGAIETGMALSRRFTDETLRQRAEAKQIAAIPSGRIGDPEEIAEAMLWLASPAASFVTGTTLAVDGGMTAV